MDSLKCQVSSCKVNGEVSKIFVVYLGCTVDVVLCKSHKDHYTQEYRRTVDLIVTP